MKEDFLLSTRKARKLPVPDGDVDSNILFYYFIKMTHIISY